MILDPPSRIIVLDLRVISMPGLEHVARAQIAARADVLVSIAAGMGVVTDVMHQWFVDVGFRLERLFFALPACTDKGQSIEMFRWFERWGAPGWRAILVADSKNEAWANMAIITRDHIARYPDATYGAIVTALTTDNYSAYRIKS